MYLHINMKDKASWRLVERWLTLSMLVAQSLRPHVTKSNGPFTAAVDEEMALRRMELRRCDNLRQFLHVRRLYIDNVFTAIFG